MVARKQASYFFCILCFAGVYFLFGFLYALDKRDTNNVLYEIFRGKAWAAAQAKEARRILLVGGSNVVWGFRSQLIEDATGIPTFNLGLIHEAHHPDTMHKLTLSIVREGDIVVYASVSFWNASDINQEATRDILRAAGLLQTEDTWQNALWNLDRYWSPYPQRGTIVTSLGLLFDRYILHKRSIHSEGLNEKGDMASCQKPGPVSPAAYVDPPQKDALISQLREFQQNLQSHGASLVLVVPHRLIAADQETLWLSAYAPLLKAMQDEFTVATPDLAAVISSNEPIFCDTGFHLGDAEAIQRSQVLGQFLKKRITSVQEARESASARGEPSRRRAASPTAKIPRWKASASASLRMADLPGPRS